MSRQRIRKPIPRHEFDEAFKESEQRLQRLRTTVYGIIENGLSEASINHLPLQSRVKDRESAWKKYSQKGYRDPFLQMTDLLGFRIVVFLESDVELANKLIRSLFELDQKNSVDKRKPERVDSVGYRSLHLVCALGKERAALAEYRHLTEDKFEIQIRTALQHAWAAIEHQQNYKGDHVLPSDLQHRLMVLAGTLELLDREFSQVVAEAGMYYDQVVSGSEDKQDDRLSEIAIDAILETEFTAFDAAPPSLSSSSSPKTDVIEELEDFGVMTVEDFKTLLKETNIEPLIRAFDDSPNSHSIGLVRDIMMVNNLEKYFKKAYKRRWNGIDANDIDYLSEALERDDLVEFFENRGIELLAGLNEEA